MFKRKKHVPLDYRAACIAWCERNGWGLEVTRKWVEEYGKETGYRYWAEANGNKEKFVGFGYSQTQAFMTLLEHFRVYDMEKSEYKHEVLVPMPHG